MICAITKPNHIPDHRLSILHTLWLCRLQRLMCNQQPHERTSTVPKYFFCFVAKSGLLADCKEVAEKVKVSWAACHFTPVLHNISVDVMHGVPYAVLQTVLGGRVKAEQTGFIS